MRNCRPTRWVDGDAARGDVAAALPRIERDPVVAVESLERFDLDERDLPIRSLVVRVSSGLREVPVPFETLTRDRADLAQAHHRPSGRGRDVDGLDSSARHFDAV